MALKQRNRADPLRAGSSRRFARHLTGFPDSLLRCTAILVALSMVSAAAVLAGTNAAQSATPESVTISLSSFAGETLDPALGMNVKFYLDEIFDYLVGVDSEGRLSKDTGLASNWEVSPDKTRWSFTLRDGVAFHNGDPVTSEDVKFSLLRASGKRSTTGYAGLLRALIGNIETPASNKVVIVTKAPSLIVATFLSRAVSTEGMVVPKNYIEAHGDDYFASHPVGSGPYRFVERVAGSYLKLEAVERHWRVGVPRYKNLYFRLVPEESTRIAMLRQGKADIIDISRDRAAEVKEAGYAIHLRRSDAVLGCWWIEPWGQSPLGDRRVREALEISINREEMADTIFDGMARPAPIFLGLSWSYPEIGFTLTPDMQYRFDLDAAKRLLAEAGHPNGFETEIYSFRLPGFPEGPAVAEALAGYWGAIGVKAKLIPVDFPAFRSAWATRSRPGALGCFNAANRNWVGMYAQIQKYGSSSEITASMHDQTLEQMIADVSREGDQDKADRLLRDILARLRQESLGIGLLDLDTPYASSKALAGWDPGKVMYDLNLDQLVSTK